MNAQEDSSTQPSPSKREVKRLRSSESDNNDSKTLPAVVWINVMQYLPFDTILSCAATCRSMLYEVMPLLKTLRIDTSSQLNIIVASRFEDVKELHINSLMTLTIDDEDEEVLVDIGTKMRAIHYCSKFSKLERLFFGGKTESGDDIEGFVPVEKEFWGSDEPYPEEGDKERMLQFIDSMSAAFDCGALNRRQLNVISGLCCPLSGTRNDRNNESNCETCLRACRSFPLEMVLSFECRGSSKEKACIGRSYGLDVCLERSQIESIIEERPGGEALLSSKERLLRLLGTGTRYTILSSDDATTRRLYIVKYSDKMLDEIRRVIQSNQLDIKKLPSSVVEDCIMQSFAKDHHLQVPLLDVCYLSHASFNYLKRIGLPVTTTFFYQSTSEIVQFIPSISQIVMNSNAQYHADISSDCIRLIGYLLDCKSSDNVQAVLSSGVIKYLVEKSESNVDVRNKAMLVMKSMLAQATWHQWISVVDKCDASAITFFVMLIRTFTPSSSVKKVCLMTLQSFISRGLVKEVIKAEAVSVLVKQILSDDIDNSWLALQSLSEIVKKSTSQRVASMHNILGPLIQKLERPHEFTCGKSLFEPRNTSTMTSGIDILRSSTMMLASLCRNKSDTDLKQMAPNLLKVVAELLLSLDSDVLINVCSVIRIVLNAVSFDDSARREIESISEQRLCKLLLDCLKDPYLQIVQASAMENIYILTLGCGDVSVQSIIEYNGLVGIRELLSRSKADSSIRKHVCWMVYNIFESNVYNSEKRIQIVLDSGIMPCVLQVLENELCSALKGALWALHSMISKGTSSQVTYLVTQSMFTRPICDLIASDNDEIASIVLMALRNVSNTWPSSFRIEELEIKVKSLKQGRKTVDEHIQKKLQPKSELEKLLLSFEKDAAECNSEGEWHDSDNDDTDDESKDLSSSDIHYEEAKHNVEVVKNDIILHCQTMFVELSYAIFNDID